MSKSILHFAVARFASLSADSFPLMPLHISGMAEDIDSSA